MFDIIGWCAANSATDLCVVYETCCFSIKSHWESKGINKSLMTKGNPRKSYCHNSHENIYS